MPIVRSRRSFRLRVRLSQPGQVVALAFASAIAVGTALLCLPFATQTGERASVMEALFTATSAVCVTGLATVDTGAFWSGFGQGVILVLIQIGGLGIMTLATLVALLLSKRLGLRTRLIAQTESQVMQFGDVARVVRRVALFSVTCEAAIAVLLTARFALGYDGSMGNPIYLGVFHAVSAFNNAGFSTFSNNLMPFIADPWILITISVAVILGGLGFPVVFELVRSWRSPGTWSVLTRMTVIITVVLLAAGTFVFLFSEFSNPRTIGDLPGPQAVVASFFSSVMPRTAGFNAVDLTDLRPESIFFTNLLMFIGGGSASTAGGIKVTTFGVLIYVVWSQAHGDQDVNVGRRRVPTDNQRQAVTIVLLAATLVGVGTFALLTLTKFPFESLLFEAISAFSTVGLSLGITAQLAPVAQIVVILLMFIGRVGPLTVASALALRQRSSTHRLPEERMIVG